MMSSLTPSEGLQGDVLLGFELATFDEAGLDIKIFLAPKQRSPDWDKPFPGQ